MKTMYEVILEMKKKKVFSEAIKVGIISPSFDNWFNIFETYVRLLDEGKKRLQAVTEVAEEFRISERSVYTVVKKMTS